MTVKRTYTDLGREAVSTAARVAARLDELKRINVELKTENAKLRDFVGWTVDMRVDEVELGQRLARELFDEIGEERF